MPPPSRPLIRPAVRPAERWSDVLDPPLTAQLLTVSADMMYDLLHRRYLPGRKVGRKWLTTPTAVLQWLEQSATPHLTAALVDAVRTGQARRGTQVQPAAQSGHVEGIRAIDSYGTLVNESRGRVSLRDIAHFLP